MKKSVAVWQWLVATAALLLVLAFIWVRVFSAPPQPVSEKIEAGPTPVADEAH